MATGAQARRDETLVPSLELDEQMLAILRDNERELDQELLLRIVRPMFDVIRQLVRENPQAAEKGVRLTIEIQGQSMNADYIGTSDVAAMFGMSQQQVRRWCEEGRIAAERSPGGTWRISTSQFERVGFLAPKAKRKRKDIKDIAGAWKDKDSLRHDFEEGRD